MKKRIALIVFLLIIMVVNTVFAATEVTMEIVEDNVCTIHLNEESTFEKKIVESDLKNHQVTLQLKISNTAEVIIPSGEIMLVIDSSSSMDEIVEGTTTRKDIVLSSAKKLVESLLKANPTSLEIGVVTFSTGSEKDEQGYVITGTEADAQKVCDFTNDLATLTSKISGIEGNGQYTNLDSGLKLAKSQFSDKDTNKYMIVLTDGLPNLAVGYNDLVSYDGLTDVINETKTTLTSLDDINLITMLTGIENEEASFRKQGDNIYTYGQVIQEVFGTEENPTNGKFYKIKDEDIEETITNKIYRDLLPIKRTLRDIVVVDYFPQYIVDNFEMTYAEGIDVSNISAQIDKKTNSITWNIEELGPGESAIIKYKLTLKEEFDENIIEKVLNTNEKVEIEYIDFDGEDDEDESEVTPKIKLSEVPQPDPEEPNKPQEPIKDETISQEPIPKAGSPIILAGIIIMAIVTIFLGYKSKNII